MSATRGYLKIISIRGVPVRVHWTFPLGGLVIALLGHVHPREWLFYCLAFTALIAIHELGHVLAAAALRLQVFEVQISGLGGLCKFQLPRRVLHSVLVYAGGLLAQAATFAVTLAHVLSQGSPSAGWGRAVYMNFVFVNLGLFVINLLPGKDNRSGLATDGTQLWRLFLHVFKGRPHPHPPLRVVPHEESPVFPAETRLLDLPGFRPQGFVQGIELLNDRTTPMEFVVACLTTHVGLPMDQALATMLEIHNTGGKLIPRTSPEAAMRIAEAISREAAEAGHALVCRYVGEATAA